jgi:hypothetical protein
MKVFWEFLEDRIVNHGNLMGNKYGEKSSFFGPTKANGDPTVGTLLLNL